VTDGFLASDSREHFDCSEGHTLCTTRRTSADEQSHLSRCMTNDKMMVLSHFVHSCEQKIVRQDRVLSTGEKYEMPCVFTSTHISRNFYIFLFIYIFYKIRKI